MDAIQFILKEHRKIRKSFAKIKKGLNKPKLAQRMFKVLGQFLVTHETMEQKVWYPKLRAHKNLRTPIKHLISEEKTAAKAIKKIKKVKDQDEFEKKFLKLKKDVDHHATEEETKLFPKVRKVVDKAELNEIGKQLRRFKLRHKK